MESAIEGFLFTFGASRQRSIYCLPTFCVLTGRRFAQFRHKGDLIPLRSGLLDNDHLVEDTGRQLVNGKILYTVRLYHVSDFSKEVLLGAVSPEETAEWIKAFTSALKKPLLQAQDLWSPSGGFRHSYSNEALSQEENKSMYLSKETLQKSKPEVVNLNSEEQIIEMRRKCFATHIWPCFWIYPENFTFHFDNWADFQVLILVISLVLNWE